jgi:type I restriction enzyme S subunit
MDLNCYKEYWEVNYDYIEKLPSNWKLVPNIALFQERIERGFPEETLLSVTIGKGIIKQEDNP